MAVADDHPSAPDLASREPSLEDLAELCAELNREGARYLAVGGFAVCAVGYDRRTMDVDLLIEATPENEAKVMAAVARLADHAAAELEPGEIAQYVAVRVADEIVVDLMPSACGIDFTAVADQIGEHEVLGVRVPFASPRLLLRMKGQSVRAKDRANVQFLERLRVATDR